MQMCCAARRNAQAANAPYYLVFASHNNSAIIQENKPRQERAPGQSAAAPRTDAVNARPSTGGRGGARGGGTAARLHRP